MFHTSTITTVSPRTPTDAMLLMLMMMVMMMMVVVVVVMMMIFIICIALFPTTNFYSVCSLLPVTLRRHHYPHGTHFSNFIGFLSNGEYSLSWLLLPTKCYTTVLGHTCLNASIPTFLLAPCDHHPLLTCTSLALIFISVHARFILQLRQSGILSLLLFIRLKP